MAGYSAPRAAVLLLALPLLISGVLGISVLIEPDAIQDGGPISISLSNVSDGSLLNITLTAGFSPSRGNSWLNFTNWNYPFALQGGRVTVSGRNVERITLYVQAGNTLKSAPPKGGTGIVALEIPLDIQPVMYHDFRIGYEVHNETMPVVLTLIQQGTKAGAERDAVLTPSIVGVGDGNLTVEVFANQILQDEGEIRVQIAPLPTPAPENTTATPTPVRTTTVTTPPAPTPARSTPSPSPSAPATTTPVPAPSPEGPFPWVVVFAAAIVVISLIADYFIMKD